MTLEEVLKSKEIGENELAVLAANAHLLTDKQKVEFGFAEPEPKEKK